MNTFNMLKKIITNRKNKHLMNQEFINETKTKLDVFLMNNRISNDEYNLLIKELN